MASASLPLPAGSTLMAIKCEHHPDGIAHRRAHHPNENVAGVMTGLLMLSSIATFAKPAGTLAKRILETLTVFVLRGNGGPAPTQNRGPID